MIKSIRSYVCKEEIDNQGHITEIGPKLDDFIRSNFTFLHCSENCAQFLYFRPEASIYLGYTVKNITLKYPFQPL